MAKQRVLVVGLGSMGMSHALAYARIPGFEVAGLCERHMAERQLPPALEKADRFTRFEDALAAVKPDAVSINTLPDSHADFAIKSIAACIMSTSCARSPGHGPGGSMPWACA